MSIAEFQRALCDMTLDPVFAASVLRDGGPRLAGYALSEIERSRLVAVARQPGMSVNCTLARANRFAPIADAFPLTCVLLKPFLRPLLDEFWSGHRGSSYQLTGEASAFLPFLQEKIAGGEVDQPYADEVLRYERAAWDLIQTLAKSGGPEPGVEKSLTVEFLHDPGVLVPCLERGETPPSDLPTGRYTVRLVLRGDTLDVIAIE